MRPARKALCAVYGCLALLALVGTLGNNFAYMSFGVIEGNVRYWQDTLANGASRSMTADVIALFVAVSIWMVLEARRLALRGVWLYIVFGVLVAISVTFPLFLISRERALSDRASPTIADEPRMSMIDIAGLGLCGIAACAYTGVSLWR